MSKRRTKGDGSVYQRASDGKWVGVVDRGWIDGRRDRRSVYGKTEKEAARKLRDLQVKVDRGEALPDGRRATGEFLNWWVTEMAPSRGIKASTIDGYAWIIKRYLEPSLGRVRLAQLTPAHVDRMLLGMAQRELSPRTRRQARAVLRAALTDAERNEWVSRNAAALSRCPEIGPSKTEDALSFAEATALLRVADRDPDGAIVYVALLAGLRRGEALALGWSDIDLDAGLITVRGTVKRRVGHGLLIDSPKTSKSARTIPIPNVCVAALQRHRKAQIAHRLVTGDAWQDNDLVFATGTGTLIDPRNLTRRFHRMTVAAGLGPRRFHALRHSAATLMRASGVPLDAISMTLGHSGLSITSDLYVELQEPLLRQAATAMDDAFGASGALAR